MTQGTASPQDAGLDLLRRAAVAALGGPRQDLARSLLARLEDGPGSGDDTALGDVIGQRVRAAGVDRLADPAAFAAWLAAPDSPALLRLAADTVAAQMFDAGAPRPWLSDALAATCAVILTDARGTRLWGSGVVVQAAPPVVMTNRHVVEGLLSAATGAGLALRPGVRLDVAFGDAALAAPRLEVLAADVSDGPDMALLHLADPATQAGLALTAGRLPAPGGLPPQPGLARLVGFPATPSGQEEKKAFARTGLVGRKCLSLGVLRFDFASGTFPDLAPEVAWHDCATCRGFSGSAVYALEGGHLAALHYEGAARTDGHGGFANLAVDLCRQGFVGPGTLAAPAAPVAPAVPVADPADGGALAAGRPTLPAALPSARWGGLPRALSIQRDLPDARDLPFQPNLADLPPRLYPPAGLAVADQGEAPTCVGHALAAAINLGLARRGARGLRASPRMLYECARAHDDLPDGPGFGAAPGPGVGPGVGSGGGSGGGSTLRGAIKGFFHNGVAPEGPPEDETAPDWSLTRDRARKAAGIRLGTYRRVGRDLDALHAAICETGAVLAGARIHSGWEAPVRGRIPRRGTRLGGHAFLLVGYDRTGFIVLNSWGEDWGGWRGRPGLAHWSYGDAAESLLDAWVLRLAVPSPAVARIVQRDRAAQPADALRRADVIGHMMPLSGGIPHDHGKFGFGAAIHAETAAYLRGVAAARRPKYRDLALVCHDLTADRARVADRTARLRAAMKPARIWPFSVAVETALGRALGPVVAQSMAGLGAIGDAGLRQITLANDAGAVVRSLWSRLPDEIAEALGPDRPGGAALRDICEGAAGLRLHLVADGLGALVAGWMLARTLAGLRVDSLTLLDPVLPDADFRALVAPAFARAAPVARYGEVFARPAPGGLGGSGLRPADLLGRLLARPFYRGGPVLGGRARMALPAALSAPGALDTADGIAALTRALGARARG